MDGTWINDGDQANTNGLSLYAISGTLEVPAPEPTTTVMTASGVAMLLFFLRRRNARLRSRTETNQ